MRRDNIKQAKEQCTELFYCLSELDNDLEAEEFEELLMDIDHHVMRITRLVYSKKHQEEIK